MQIAYMREQILRYFAKQLQKSEYKLCDVSVSLSVQIKELGSNCTGFCKILY